MRGLGACGEIEVDIVGDKQVEQAVAVVVEKGAAGAEAVAWLEQAGLRGDIGEGAVAVVAVEAVLAVVGDEEVFEAIVVVVADADADGPAGVA